MATPAALERYGRDMIVACPGLGIDLDEKLTAKFPITDDPPFDMHWGNTRRRDGTVVKP